MAFLWVHLPFFSYPCLCLIWSPVLKTMGSILCMIGNRGWVWDTWVHVVLLVLVQMLIEPPLKLSPNDKMLPSFERGAIYLLKSAHISWNHYFVNFWEALQFVAAMPQLHTFHLDLHPPSTCPTKSSNNRCLGYAAFECHANFQINWESIAHSDQRKTCQGYVAPKSWRWQLSSRCLWTSSTIIQLRAHSHIWINPEIANFVQSKWFMCLDTADLNMNKRSSWNSLETIRTNIKGSEWTVHDQIMVA